MQARIRPVVSGMHMGMGHFIIFIYLFIIINKILLTTILGYPTQSGGFELALNAIPMLYFMFNSVLCYF